MADTNGTQNEDLSSKILHQMEYYFGDYNLPRDKFLQQEMKLDKGWIPLEIMVKFNRLAKLSKDLGVIAGAMSSSELLEVNEEKTKIRRREDRPLPEFEDFRKECITRTVYCKGFDTESTKLDDLLEFFSTFGQVESVKMRNYLDKATKEHHFKGSVFVVFTTNELAKAFMDLNEVKYGDIVLLRKMQDDYFQEKSKEAAEKRQAKIIKKEKPTKHDSRPFPLGAILQMTGFPDDSGITREDIKEALGPFLSNSKEEKSDEGAESKSTEAKPTEEKPDNEAEAKPTEEEKADTKAEATEDKSEAKATSSTDEKPVTIAYVEFKKGDTLGWLRTAEQQGAVKIVERIQQQNKDLQVTIKNVPITVNVVEGEEEQEFLKKVKEDMERMKSQRKSHKRGTKRYGGNMGHNAKRRRH